MRFIRFDSIGGGSGDMILSALISLGADPAAMAEDLRTVLPDRFDLRWESIGENGLFGEKLTVDLPDEPHHHHHHHEEHHHEHSAEHHCEGHHHTEHHHEHQHHHRSFADIRRMITSSGLEEPVRKHAVGIFQLLAQAEGTVHHREPDDVHFHEVGAADSIIDITGSAIGFARLGVEAIQVGPLPVGFGSIECAHGLIPIPAPATAELIRMGNLVTAPDGEPCEMLTPTAAAIFAYWPKISGKNYRVLRSVNAFGHRTMPGRPNLLRALLCETVENEENKQFYGFPIGPEPADPADETIERVETLIRLDCNLDDISAEQIAAAAKACFEAGGLDVWITPILMKKGRPAQVLSVLALPKMREKLLNVIFQTTGTFGIREESIRRYALGRRFETVETAYGPAAVKLGLLGGKILTASPEYDDILHLSEEKKVPYREIYDEAKSIYRQNSFQKE